MVGKSRDLTEKYRSIRLPSDAVYLSHALQTVFNKFTKRGKKTTARRYIFHALKQFRYSVRRPRVYNTLLRTLWDLRIQFALVAKREGKKIVEVPVPVRRNKRDILNINLFYTAIKRRKERRLDERFAQELLSLTMNRSQSPTLRQRSAYYARVYEERVNMQKRWK